MTSWVLLPQQEVKNVPYNQVFSVHFIAAIVFTASVLKRTGVFITNDNDKIALPNASSVLKYIYVCVYICVCV